MSTFTCPHYGGVTMPSDRQQEFCAKRNRKADKNDHCFSCETGMSAAEAEAFGIRAAINTTDHHAEAQARRWDMQKSTEKGEDTMGVTKEKICVDCKKPFTPTSNVQKRCTACGEKHRNTKNPAKPAKSHPAAKKQAETCGNCRALEILVLTGIITKDQVDAAKKLAHQAA